MTEFSRKTILRCQQTGDLWFTSTQVSDGAHSITFISSMEASEYHRSDIYGLMALSDDRGSGRGLEENWNEMVPNPRGIGHKGPLRRSLLLL